MIGLLFMGAVVFLPKGLMGIVRPAVERMLAREAQAMTAPILEIRDLSVSFGGLRAVDDVSFAVARNRITTVIGPNGAGKSTLFNLISGALRPRNGQVLIEGVEYTGQPPYRMQAAGLARSFQITNLFFELSVAENLRLAAQMLEPLVACVAADVAPAASRRRALTNCWSVSASPPRRGYPVGKLSHGEQRRLEVAVALAWQAEDAAARRADPGHEPRRHARTPRR